MAKALILASVASMIDQFNMHNIALLQELGYEVQVACNFEDGSTCDAARIRLLRQRLAELGVAAHQIDFSRSLTGILAHLRAYRQVKRLVREEHYDLIHCHSPIGGMICRWAARGERRRGTGMLYTAHGFHFYRGASLNSWLLFYPIEKQCARFTDTLITINAEDYALAQKKMCAKRVEYVPGVGIHVERFGMASVDRAAKRREIGVPEDAFVMISVGELNRNKNQQIGIRALAALDRQDVYYWIVGHGRTQARLERLARRLSVADRVRFLGYRDDVPELYRAADVCLFPSVREGLGLAAVEGLAAGLPLVCSANRGTAEYARNGENAFVCAHDSVEAFRDAMEHLYSDVELRKRLGENGQKTAERFDYSHVTARMREIYSVFSKKE